MKSSKNSVLSRARLFAYSAHNGQFRKDGRTPYINHPKAVVGILRRAGVVDENILSAGWLHDVVEDCGITRSAIRKNFGETIASYIDGVTEKKSLETRKDFMKRISLSSYPVKIIKMADVLHNMRTVMEVPLEKRVGLYKSMGNYWNVYKTFAFNVCRSIALLLEKEYKKLGKQMEKSRRLDTHS